jgi:hypothetical protein
MKWSAAKAKYECDKCGAFSKGKMILEADELDMMLKSAFQQ